MKCKVVSYSVKLARSNISKLAEIPNSFQFKRKLSAGYSKHWKRTIFQARIFLAVIRISGCFVNSGRVRRTISGRENNFPEQILLIDKIFVNGEINEM